MIKGTRTKQTLAYRTTLVHRSEDITVVKLDKPTIKHFILYSTKAYNNTQHMWQNVNVIEINENDLKFFLEKVNVE